MEPSRRIERLVRGGNPGRFGTGGGSDAPPGTAAPLLTGCQCGKLADAHELVWRLMRIEIHPMASKPPAKTFVIGHLSMVIGHFRFAVLQRQKNDQWFRKMPVKTEFSLAEGDVLSQK